MPREIEHKFLIHPECLPKLPAGERIIQGYLSTQPTVRVRLVSRGKKSAGFLTIKGPGFRSRAEYEYPIPPQDARELLKLCGHVKLEKIRYKFDGWEIDRFLGAHKGLWLAEFELKHTRQKLPPLPDWIDREVTGDARYSNSNLALRAAKP
jgi:CYTH domain-containing protein